MALVALLALVSLPQQSVSREPEAIMPPGGEFRAYWVDAFGDDLFDAARIDAIVASTKAARLNAIVVQAVRRGDCFCNRASVPRTEQAGVAPFPFDPLQTLIDKAHAQGIEVHAWMIATAIWRDTTPPSSPAHVFNLHGPTAPGPDNWIMTREDGQTQLASDWYIDPGHPDAAQWIVNTATSLVANYAIDGINLDRIRYPDGNYATNVPSWGYNPVAVGRFQQATGRTDRPQPQDPEWTQWRRDQITGIVRKVYVESYAIRPSVRVSADTITYGFGPQTQGGFQNTRAYAEQLQDWDGWMREGILDLNIPMNYKRDQTSPSDQRRMYQEWSDFTKDQQYGRQAVVGSAPYLNDIAATVRQVRTAVAPSSAGNYGAGWVGYSYRTPDSMTNAGTRSSAASRAELERALTQVSSYDPLTPPVFASSANIPPMTWKTQPTTGHLRGIARASNGTILAQTTVLLFSASSGAIVRSLKTDGGGWFAFVDLAPGSYRVEVSGGTLGSADVVAGRLTTLGQGAPTPTPTPTPSPTPPVGCVGSVGPGIAPPASVPSGVRGFHASWYGQSGYPTLCAGQTSTAVVAYANSGSFGWVSGRMGEVAYLGTWEPEPGQDQATPLGGDGQLGSPATGWPRYNRIAVQPAPYVGPGQVAWFQFTIQAPTAPGTYRLYLRPLIEGAQWMEDYGVFWVVTVKT
ncbi:MAG TPA: family 10 glycosylhydrolase [Candidatus Limnocylindria bacterium]|nr:family 10 glycosylhydrolase [Candidatus Limnocylindria bacterium]